MINFVSNLPPDLRTGGFSAMNAAARAALAAAHDLAYVGPIDPPVDPVRKAVSKARRVSGLGGDFAAFSEARLAAIAREVEQGARPGAALDFFHGFTPWTATRPRRPYMAWSDCIFPDYVEIFHDAARFAASDLARIEQAERDWLRGARRALFTSEWAAGRAVARYGLAPARVGSVGIFGEMSPPAGDAFEGGAAFAFVSTDFAAKGGPTVLAAFERLRQTHPEARLTVAGAPPGGSLPDGAVYAGFLRKEVPAELARLREILASAVAVVHPTRGDIAPLLLVEAALFGCPAIASRAFAIPELVDHGVSGWLVDATATAEAVADAMAWMLDHPDAYAAMRRAAWARSRAVNDRDRFESRLRAFVGEALVESAAAAA